MNTYSEEEIVGIVQRQTNYTTDEINEKLKKHSGNYIKVIEEYMEITEKVHVVSNKSKLKEKYKQMRGLLDTAMKEYRDKNPIDKEQLSNNIEESEKRKNNA